MAKEQLLESDKLPGPYTPTIIIHGGAGAISRARLTPELYKSYESSLSSYLTSTRDLLFDGTNALTAAVHAVSLLEDDPLFNCGRGSVFTEKGTIEMEASVMVASVRPDAAKVSVEANGGIPPEAFHKRGAGVILIRETRHPIQLAEQVLLHTKKDEGSGSMHCQLSGPDLEETGFKEWGMERKGRDWFWTKSRWEEHLKGLHKAGVGLTNIDLLPDLGDGYDSPSQGTVGCICMDQWGNVVAATSTGGLTNKKAGRIGDTPTLGAGFFAESWEEFDHSESTMGTYSARPLGVYPRSSFKDELYRSFQLDLRKITSCLPFAHLVFGDTDATGQTITVGKHPEETRLAARYPSEKNQLTKLDAMHQPSRIDQLSGDSHRPQVRRRAIAVSGTGNGDSFLRVNAARTVAARSRLLGSPLNQSLPAMAGPGGELQQSADDRWGSGEGEGGMIGIEVIGPVLDGCSSEKSKKLTGEVVWDFNCAGMWRAFWDGDKPKVMVFREEFETGK